MRSKISRSASRLPLLAALSLLLLFRPRPRRSKRRRTWGRRSCPARRALIAIRNARIVTVSGADIENGTVVIANGKIAAVGANVAVPAGAQEIDGRGLTVYPGMIDLGTAMGLVEIPQGANRYVDVAEVGDMNPNAQAFVGINPHSAHRRRHARQRRDERRSARRRAGSFRVRRRSSTCSARRPQEMAVVPSAALVVNYPRAGGGGGFGGFFAQPQGNPTEAAAQRATVRSNNFAGCSRDAEAYGRAMDAAERDRKLAAP